ncbi:MAG: pirin family protein [Acidimicrobiales bacterium]
MEILVGNRATVGGGDVVRLLPKRAHRTIGAWCFADHFGPADVDEAAMAVGPHPHIGLQTVTWLFDGEALHTDSLGSEQLIRPGQLNLMTAGHGIAHAEQSPFGASGALHGMQLWVALPDSTRSGDPRFEHHASLPEVALPGGDGHVLLGSFGGATSPARADTAIVGVDLTVRAVIEVPLDPAFEHGVLVPREAVEVDGVRVEPGTTAYLAPGRSSVRLGVPASGAGPARVLLLGGAPFDGEILMSWNFVARSRVELDQAYADWADVGSGRFGEVRSPLARIPAPTR